MQWPLQTARQLRKTLDAFITAEFPTFTANTANQYCAIY